VKCIEFAHFSCQVLVYHRHHHNVIASFSTAQTSPFCLTQSVTCSFHRQGLRSQSLQVRSSYDLELYSTKYQATTIHWLFQTQSQNSPLFPPRLAMFSSSLYASASDSSSLEFMRYINSVIIIIILIAKMTQNRNSGLTVAFIRKLLSHSRPWPWVCGLGFDASGFVNHVMNYRAEYLTRRTVHLVLYGPLRLTFCLNWIIISKLCRKI